MPPYGWLSLPERPAPSVTETVDDNYGSAAESALQILANHRQNIGAPALSAAVAIEGNIVWRGAVGYADLDTSKPVSLRTQFRIGSTSKAITATALARLVQRGAIDLDRPIGAYLTPLPNQDWATITPRQLASHTAGLPHYKENRDWLGLYQTIALRKHFENVEDALEIFDDAPLLFEPGTGFHYSTLGTVLLGAVMARASDSSYRDLVQREVLAPAQMTKTIVAPSDPSAYSELARFYYRDGNRYREWRHVDLSHRLPGGGFASTPTDLVRLGSLYLDDAYLSQEMRQVFWAPQKFGNDQVNPQRYALGWRWREWDVPEVGLAPNANHGGVSRGAQAWLLVFPEHRTVIAFCINVKTATFGDFGRLYEPLLRVFNQARLRTLDSRERLARDLE